MIYLYRLSMFVIYAVYNFAILYGISWCAAEAGLLTTIYDINWNNIEIAALAGVVQFIGYCLLCSPIGVFLLDSCEPFRKPSTREREKLEPLLNEVVETYQENAGLKKKPAFRLYMMDDEDANAFAFGKNKMAFTTGFLRDFLQKEVIKGVMAHELAHLHYKDISWEFRAQATGSALLILFGLLSGVMKIITFIADIIPLLYIIVTPLHFAYAGIAFIFNLKDAPLEMLNSFGILLSRRIEYRADKFAAGLVGHKGMVSFFEAMKLKEKVTERGLFVMQRQSHPPTELRIDKIGYS